MIWVPNSFRKFWGFFHLNKPNRLNNPLCVLNISPACNSSRNSKWDLHCTKSNVFFTLCYRWNQEDNADNIVFTRFDFSFVWFCTYSILSDIFSGSWNVQWFHSQKQVNFSLFKWFDTAHYRHSKIHSSKKCIHFILRFYQFPLWCQYL